MLLKEHAGYKSSIPGVIILEAQIIKDERGWLAETFRCDVLGMIHIPMMGYLSFTKSEVIRGPHEHKQQSDMFVFVGPGTFELYLWDNRIGGDGDIKITLESRETYMFGPLCPGGIIIPPGVVHGYKNISKEDGLVINLPNRLYAGYGKNEPVDEIRWEKQLDNPFVIPKTHRH